MPRNGAQQPMAEERRKASKPVFISCTRCRARKIRCPAQKPTCENCLKKGYHCHYDTTVKRRGPDKEPGGRLKPRGAFVNCFVGSNGAPSAPIINVPTLTPTVVELPTQIESITPRYQQPGTVSAARQTWRAALFQMVPEKEVLELCSSFLEDMDVWYSFFHRGLFFKSFFTKELGPHVVYAILAHMTFLREGKTRVGQLRALHYAEEARKIVDYCLSASYTEPTLAQTALLLVSFEFQPHIHQNLARATASLGYMETCARACLAHWSSENADASDRIMKHDNDQAQIRVIRREEMRQMYWTLSHLSANSTIWRHLASQPSLGVATADPATYDQLFPRDLHQNQAANRLTAWTLYCEAVRLWHNALNSPADTLSITRQARKLLENCETVSNVGSRNYVWQAQEWALAARGHLGDLEVDAVEDWFKRQITALVTFSSKSQATEKAQRPTYCWWYLMVAYTALSFAYQQPSTLAHCEEVLGHVYAALDAMVALWPCTALSHHYTSLKRKHADLRARV